MDIYLTNIPATAHKFVHPQDEVGPIWTGQLVQVNKAVGAGAFEHQIAVRRAG